MKNLWSLLHSSLLHMYPYVIICHHHCDILWYGCYYIPHLNKWPFKMYDCMTVHFLDRSKSRNKKQPLVKARGPHGIVTWRLTSGCPSRVQHVLGSVILPINWGKANRSTTNYKILHWHEISTFSTGSCCHEISHVSRKADAGRGLSVPVKALLRKSWPLHVRCCQCMAG